MNTGLRPSGHKVTNGFKKIMEEVFLLIFLILKDKTFYLMEVKILYLLLIQIINLYIIHFVENGLPGHPTRMQIQLTEYFIRFLTDKNDIIEILLAEVIHLEWLLKN